MARKPSHGLGMHHRKPHEDPRRRCFCAKQPLEIVELDLEGPKAGEVLVEIMATGVCHTDAYTLDGFDGRGFSRLLGHEGAGLCAKSAQA